MAFRISQTNADTISGAILSHRVATRKLAAAKPSTDEYMEASRYEMITGMVLDLILRQCESPSETLDTLRWYAEERQDANAMLGLSRIATLGGC